MPIQLKSEALPPPRKSSEWQVKHAPEPRNSALPAAWLPTVVDCADAAATDVHTTAELMERTERTV
jgi:hypothetical protein